MTQIQMEMMQLDFRLKGNVTLTPTLSIIIRLIFFNSFPCSSRDSMKIDLNGNWQTEIEVRNSQYTLGKYLGPNFIAMLGNKIRSEYFPNVY